MKGVTKEVNELELIANKLLQEKKTTHGLARSLRSLLKEIAMYKSHESGLKKNKNINKYDKVQIGGGKHMIRGFLNIDIIPPADIIFDVREGLPLKTASVNLVFSEHFLEHIDYPVSAKKFINECFRVLKKGGRLVLGVPDSKLILLAYLKKDKKFQQKMIHKWYSNRNCLNHFNTYIDLVNYHFRDQDDDQKYNPHYWSYDFEKLVSITKGAGFKKTKKWKFDSSIANPKRKWGSLYIEGVK